ncbi:hypothetical protein Bestia_00033 [Acinetobacter phage Bestia]|nr:hypothetical protein Bestia_00033 [Acinetobacter phage Bestia]
MPQLVYKDGSFLSEVKEFGLNGGEDRPEAARLKKEGKFICGLQWDTSKANKATCINKPAPYNPEEPTWNQLKSTGHWGDYYVITETLEESQEAFKLLCHKLVEKRKEHFIDSLKSFEEIGKKFLDKHAK